ncbi:MAG: HEPN domain-containing protein [Thermoprotei archaeon]
MVIALFDPRKFMDIAICLCAKRNADEARVRTSIGRLYYACYLTARQSLENKGYKFYRNSEDHRLIREYLSQENKTDVVNKISKLREMRNYADYDLIRILTENDFKRMLLIAQDVLKKL